MSKAELMFKQHLTRVYPKAFIKKLPDFKQTGNSTLRGLPDYLVINSGTHDWIEVKYTTSLNVFNLNGLNPYQWIEFNKMLKAGVNVQIVIYDGKYRPHWTTFATLLVLRESGKTSFHF